MLVLPVFLGGALGTWTRWAATKAFHPQDGWPVPTLLVNLVGAFILGALLEALARRGLDVGARRTVRLLVGTGFCGGLTTMSTLATETFLLIDQHRAGLALGYLATSLVAGALLAWLGVLAGFRIGDHR